MRRPVPQIIEFDNRDPDRHQLYPMLMPHGPRVIAVTTGLKTELWLTDGKKTLTSLTGFVPQIEKAVSDLYHAMLSEPLPGITENGQLKYRPGIVYDLILHDRTGGGEADVTEAALAEFLFDETAAADDDTVCALVLATLPKSSFEAGKDDADLWLRRSHLRRGCRRLGAENPYANPHPIIRCVTIAPGDWAFPELGCGGETAGRFWVQVDNCFKHGYKGCLVMDVLQPWNVRGNHFQFIREEDSI